MLFILYKQAQYNSLQLIFKRHHEQFGLTGILGFVDGTHVNIKAPISQDIFFINQKSHQLLNEQIVKPLFCTCVFFISLNSHIYFNLKNIRYWFQLYK